jgi:hypothetical protein
VARGFESKAVDSHRQDVEDEREARRRGKPLDVHEIERRQKREGLELSRRRIVTELAAATNDRRRESLRAALAHLETELSKLQ